MHQYLQSAGHDWCGAVGPQRASAWSYGQTLEERVPLVIPGGSEYGTRPSRDWAAKGPLSLGVTVVIAKSFERIHRSNLVGMGVLPLMFEDGEDADVLALTGAHTFDIEEFEKGAKQVKVLARDAKGSGASQGR